MEKLDLDKSEQQIIHELVLENQRLLTENNQLLKKMNRRATWEFWFRVLWMLFLIGFPFVLYYYVLQPYFTSFGSSFDTFLEGMQEIPGWRQFYEARGGE